MPLDRPHWLQRFATLGSCLNQPTTLCLFGRAPGLLLGQPSLQIGSITAWQPESDYAANDLAQACTASGIVFHEHNAQADTNATGCLWMVRSGPASLPDSFETEPIGRFGKLSLTMPVPAVLCAASLGRGHADDVDDIAWWFKVRQLDLEEVERAVDTLPSPDEIEKARSNLIYARLVAADE